MKNGLDLEFVRETYAKLPDNELVHIATENAAGLTPEAQQIIEEEIRRRKLDANLLLGVKAQNRDYTIEEIDRYCNLIQNLNCPVCNSSTSNLNAGVTAEVMSFIIFTNYKKRLQIACSDCLDKANSRALLKTLILGWWGLPWGIIRTIQAISINIRNKKLHRTSAPNDSLRGFVVSNIGQIETYTGNAEKLQEVISMN